MGAGPLLCLAMLACFAGASRAERATLSDADRKRIAAPLVLSEQQDGRYAVLEDIQRRHCADSKALSCRFDTKQCSLHVLALMEAAQPPLSDLEFNAALNQLVQICGTQATPYEDAATHWLLEGALRDVDAAATQHGHHLETRPIIGALPLKQLNAGAISSGVPVILVNERFILFVADFAALACQSVPKAMKNGRDVELFISEQSSFEEIASNQELAQAALDLYDFYFLDSGVRAHYEWDAFCEGVKEIYGWEALRFVVAHEYGHLLLGHPHSALETDSIRRTLTPARVDGSAPSKLIRELEADMFAIRMLARMPPPSGADRFHFSRNSMRAVEFYFAMREIYATSVADGETSPRVPDRNKAEQIARRIAECIDKSECTLRSFSMEIESVLDHADHPPPEFRRRVAQLYRAKRARALKSEKAPEASALERNAWMIWAEIEPKWRCWEEGRTRFDPPAEPGQVCSRERSDEKSPLECVCVER
jgi:hypothetical protein